MYPPPVDILFQAASISAVGCPRYMEGKLNVPLKRMGWYSIASNAGAAAYCLPHCTLFVRRKDSTKSAIDTQNKTPFASHGQRRCQRRFSSGRSDSDSGLSYRDCPSSFSSDSSSTSSMVLLFDRASGHDMRNCRHHASNWRGVYARESSTLYTIPTDMARQVVSAERSRHNPKLVKVYINVRAFFSRGPPKLGR
ncbi:hypothetical protein AcW1_007608 [Taiwanofungus camphoratus]|nr:hypothetical protein AcW1_007608 [Antrodia cinnamomea]